MSAVAVPQTRPATSPSQAWSCAQPSGVSVNGRPMALPDHPPTMRPTVQATPRIASVDGRRSRRIHAAVPAASESGDRLDEDERDLRRRTVVERVRATDDERHGDEHAASVPTGEAQRHPGEDAHEESVHRADDEPEDRRARAEHRVAVAAREVERETSDQQADGDRDDPGKPRDHGRTLTRSRVVISEYVI